MRKISNQFYRVLCISALILACTGIKAHAATLQISPTSGTYNVGDTFRVRVTVSSGGQSINAVAATISYSDTVVLTSVSKSGSILNLWAQEPNFSNTTRTAHFEGVALNGYTGSSGTALTLNFRAARAGPARVSISNASVLANDGEGTDLFKGSGGAVFTIGAVTAPKPTNDIGLLTVEEVRKTDERNPQSKFVVVLRYPASNQAYQISIDGGATFTWIEEGNQVYETPTLAPGKHTITFTTTDSRKNNLSVTKEFLIAEVGMPIFTEYSPSVFLGDYVVIKGTADPNTTVIINRNPRASGASTSTVATDSFGKFIYVSDNTMPEGTYSFSAKARTAEGFESLESAPISIVVRDAPLTRFGKNATVLLSVAIPIAAMLILLVLLILFLLRKIKSYKERVRSGLKEIDIIAKKDMTTLATDVDIYERIGAKNNQEMSAEERGALSHIRKDIERTSGDVTKRIQDLENL